MVIRYAFNLRMPIPDLIPGWGGSGDVAQSMWVASVCARVVQDWWCKTEEKSSPPSTQWYRQSHRPSLSVDQLGWFKGCTDLVLEESGPHGLPIIFVLDSPADPRHWSKGHNEGFQSQTGTVQAGGKMMGQCPAFRAQTKAKLFQKATMASWQDGEMQIGKGKKGQKIVTTESCACENPFQDALMGCNE